MLTKSLAVVVAVLCVLLGVQTVRLSGVTAEFAGYRADVAENTRKAEALAREKENTMRASAEKIAYDQAQKEAELAARVAAADAVADGLRNEIDRLNAAPVPADAGAAAFAGQARTARKLLGACAERYRGLAQDADRIRDQVIGLQGFVAEVCRN